MTTEKRRNQHKIEPRKIYGTSLRRKPLDSSVFVTELASNKFHFAMCSNFRKPHENVPGVFFATRKRSGNNLESHGRSSDGPVGWDHNFNSWNLLAWRMGFFLKLYLYVICTVRSSDAFSFICSNCAWSLKVTCVTSVLAPLVSLRNRTARVWQTWQGYYLRVLSLSLLNILCFLVFYKKISLKEGEVWRKDISKQNYCHACHTRFAVFLPLSSCCLSSLLSRARKHQRHC